MKKRILLTLLAAALLLGAFAMNVSAENATVVESWSITLGDSIGTNFYFKLPEQTAKVSEVKVTIAGQTQICQLSEQAAGIYKICVEVAPAQMTEAMILQLVVNGVEYTPVSYCVRDYAEHILNADYPEKVIALVRHMLDYGTAAQHYFEVNTGYPANDQYELEYKAQYPAEYPKLTIDGEVDGLRLYGASLVMDSRVAVRYYFAADSVEGVTFRANGVSYTPVEKDDMFYVEIPGILPQNYADPIVLSAAKGNEKLEVTYSPLTYFVRMSEKGSQQMKNLVNAMYGYYEAAVAYLDSASATVSVPAAAGGTVTVDKISCQWGDTVTLTVTPAAGYNLQSLVVERDGRAVDIGSISLNGGVYNFVAEDGEYVVKAEFAEPVFSVIKGDWDLRNQYNGSITIANKTTEHAAIISNACHYNEVTVTVKDYTPSKNEDGSLKQGDFSMQAYFIFDDGKEYQVRLHNTDEDGNYKLQHMGEANSLFGWEWQADLTSTQKEKLLNGNGVRFTVKLVGANAELWVDDTLMKTVSLGEEYNGKMAQVKLCMNGNVGVQNIEIPYTLTRVYNAAAVTIPAFENGTVTADKLSYKIGDTVTLTVTPDAGYSQKLHINGEPLLLDWKTNTYSFVAAQADYKITGSFEPSLKVTPSDANRWDSSNQAHGVITAYYPSDNDSWWYTFDGRYQSVAVKAKNYWPVADSQDGNGNVGFATILRVTMDNGNAYAFRVINDKGTYAYDRYGGNGLTGWGGWKNLSSLASQFNGDGVDFELARTGDNVLTLSVNGTVMENYTMADITADNKVASVSVQHNGNKGEKIIIPFTLEKSPDADDVELNIADFTGGTVTADKTSYKIGDTVTLTIAPDAGNSQKIFLNDEPLLLDWKSNTYSFVAQKNTYNITGSFEKSLSTAPSDANRFDTANEAHGILNAYYPADNDSWWMDIKGDYKSISVKAKNYWAVDDSYEGIANGGGFRIVLRATMDNGKNYAFSVWIDTQKRYAYNHFGGGSSETGWSGAWCAIADKNAAAVADFNADGAEFKLERIDGNHFQITLNGTVLETYTIPDVTSSNKAVSVGVAHYGNKGVKVEIPFTLVNNTYETRFQTSDLSKYVIVYDDSISDYATLANQLKTQISEKYGVSLSVVSDSASTPAQYEILLGDTNRYDYLGRVMEYSVTVSGGHFRINVGGLYSAEKAIADLCDNVFNGQVLSLPNGDYYKCSLLTASREITSGTTARVMTANVLADAFDDGSHENAKYRAEIFAGMLVSYTPDVVGMQEVDGNWSEVLDGYLTKIAKTHGVQYSRYLATYEGKTNYTSLLYRSDKFKVENSGVKPFTWWTNSIFNHNYHMRNVSWAQFSSLTDTSKKFIVANTHWSYNSEHVGKTLAGSSQALQSGDLKRQCKDETNAFLSSLKTTYSDCPIFVTGDFNTSLPYFTTYGWTPANYNVISQQAKSNGTALSTVPDSGHYDHIFGTGSYTVKCYEFFNSVNQHSALTDHPFAYADLEF